ncbi:MAG: hypothetical protein JXR07_20385, partial [Reichenbachiella sp.]
LCGTTTRMNFNELFESIYSQNLHHEPRKFIEQFEHNRILIEGQKTSNNPTLYDNVTRLCSDYAHCLVCTENYKEATSAIEKAILLFQEHPDYKDQDLLDVFYYETILFDRVQMNYHAKNFEEVVADLNILSNKFPTNEKYSNWMKGAKLQKLYRIEKLLYFTMLGGIIGDLFLDDSQLILKAISTVILVASIITIAVLEFIKWRRKKST